MMTMSLITVFLLSFKTNAESEKKKTTFTVEE